MNSYVCITAGEWRNLCSTGRIRILEGRGVSPADQLGPESYESLFSLAPDRFILGETSDFLIAEYICLRQEIEGIQPPGFAVGARWLLLQDVIRFFPLRSDDTWAFEADALKAQVALSDALFERPLSEWLKNQLTDQACINGLNLKRVLWLGKPSQPQVSASADWRSLARQIANSDQENSNLLLPTANLISRRDRLFDLVREDADCGAFFVSCPIEWINLAFDINVFDSDSHLAGMAQQLHQKYLKVSFEPSLACAADLKEFEAILLAKTPELFSGAWRPAMISLYVRSSHKIRFGSLTPDYIIASVRALESLGDRPAAEMLAFLFGATLGANKTHSIERALDLKRFVVARPPEVSTPPAQSFQVCEVSISTADTGTIPTKPVKVSRISEREFLDISGDFHVLTYAEDGFSPLTIHAKHFGLDLEQSRTFANAVNDLNNVGSLHPQAPISAVPRELVRNRQDASSLAISICQFFLHNRESIKSRRLVFDFRTPSVPVFVIEALNLAIESDVDNGLEEVLILGP
jgi:hypothetical protein